MQVDCTAQRSISKNRSRSFNELLGGGKHQIGPITSIHIIASCSCQMSECVFSKSYFMPTMESRLSINHSDLTSGSQMQELIKWIPFGTRGSHGGRQKGAEKLVVRIRISQERL